MSAFDLGLDALFEDDNLALDALWRAGGGQDGVPVRVMRTSPEGIVGIGDNRFDLDAMLISVRLSEVAEPATGDEVDLLDEDGAVQSTLAITHLAKIDPRRSVRTCEVSVLADDP